MRIYCLLRSSRELQQHVILSTVFTASHSFHSSTFQGHKAAELGRHKQPSLSLTGKEQGRDLGQRTKFIRIQLQDSHYP